MDFKEIMKKRIAPVIVAGVIGGSALSSVPIVVNAEENSIVSEAEIKEKTRTSTVFKTRQEAETWLKEKIKTIGALYEITDTNIYVYEDKISEQHVFVVKEEFEEKKELDKYIEDLNKKGYDNSNLVVTELKTVNKYTEKVTVDKTFNSLEELNEYKNTLEGKTNLELNISDVSGDWVESSEKKVCDISKTSKEELDSYIEYVKKTIKECETENLLYSVRVEESVVENMIPTQVSEQSFSETFNSLEEAKEFILQKQEEVKEDKDNTYEFSEVIERTETVVIENSEINEVFNTKEDADAYISQLELEGYKLSNIEIIDESKYEEKVYETGKINFNSSSKLDSSSHYEVSGNYIIIKQASGNVCVWTAGNLTEIQKESFKNTYLENNYDPSISNDTNFVFISGVGEFDLSYIASNWGVYTINYSDGIITMECSSDKISHLNYGYYEKEKTEESEHIESYRVTGNKSKEETRIVYDLNYSKKTQEYEKITSYQANIYVTSKEKKTGYRLTGAYDETKENINTGYSLNGEAYLITKTDGYVAEIKYLYNDYDEIPKTGDESNIELYTAALTGATLGLVNAGIKVKTKRKNKQK